MDIGSWKFIDVDVNIILKKFDLLFKILKLLFFFICVFKKFLSENYWILILYIVKFILYRYKVI